MNKRRKFRKTIAVMSLIFVCIVCALIIEIKSTKKYNSTERTVHGSDKICSVELYPRGGTTDSWTKIMNHKDDHIGIIYEGVITNSGKYDMSDWSLRINIEDDMYLNNAWCGQIEVHQMNGDAEIIQTVDLRDYDEKEILLEHIMADGDLMIPLHKGDYLIYLPNPEVDEYPIMGTGLGAGNPGEVGIGLILCYQEDLDIDLTNIELTYYLHKQLKQDILFIITFILGVIWLIVAIIFVTVELNLIKMRKRMRNDEQIIKQAFSVFSKFFDAKDELTKGHSLCVAQYSRLLAQKLGMSEEECDHIYYIALMHDCGKVWIPDSILKKPGKLTDKEFATMKTHTTNGAEMLENFTSIEGIRDGALYHHERYDGHGYPTGKSGKDIPLIGRLICVADSFDAMNSDRCYRERMSKSVILEKLRNNSGKQFDADIVKVLLELIEEGKVDLEKP